MSVLKWCESHDPRQTHLHWRPPPHPLAGCVRSPVATVVVDETAEHPHDVAATRLRSDCSLPAAALDPEPQICVIFSLSVMQAFSIYILQLDKE